MAFEKKTWVDEDTATDTDPRLEAAELNRLEDGIANAFSLGSAPDGTPNIQNDYGTIYISSPNANDLTYTGDYLIDGTSQLNTPYAGGWYLRVIGSSNVYTKQTVYSTTTSEAYERTFNNKTWSDWKLIRGEVVLYNNATGVGQSGTFTTSQYLGRFGSARIILIGNAAYGTEGKVNTHTDGNYNVRASVTDIDANGITIIQNAVFSFGTNNTVMLVTNVRSARQMRGTTGNATTTYLNVVKVIGLP